MSRGSASWLLPYPPERLRYKGDWTGKRNCGQGISHWRKFMNLCRELKRTRCEYSVTYIDMGKHCRALVLWEARS